MKILAIADAVSNPSRIEELLGQNPDLIVTLGDLSLEDLRILKNTQIPKVGIYGNHCSDNYLEYLGIRNLHLKQIELNNLKIGGFEGCVKYKNSSYQYTQKQASELLASFPPVDLFISHAPPEGINDNPDEDSHQGFSAFQEYILKYNPRFWLHGHSYPSKEQKISLFQQTMVIYIHDVELIDLREINQKSLPISKSYSSY